MSPLLEEEFLPTDPEGLRAHVAVLESDLAASEGRVRELMADEDPARGVFHAPAIHETKQLMMMLRYQRDLCLARLNRMANGF